MTEKDIFSSTEGEEKDLFDDKGASSSDPGQEGYIEKLVGEGKKFKTVEDLARGKIESDQFIDNLKREMQELREELGKQEYSRELLNKLSAKDKATESGAVNPGKEVGTNPKNLSQDDVKALVEEHIRNEEKKRTYTQNVTKASTEVEKLYKEKAREVLETRASELGMTVERLKDIAGESPTAFLKLMGAEEIKEPSTQLPKTQINTATQSNSSDERNWAWWQNLRRENKRKYFSPEMSKLRYQDEVRLGERFGLPKT